MDNNGQLHIEIRSKNILKRLFKNSDIMFIQLPDKYTIKGAEFVPSQPSDFIVMYNKNKSAFLEYKWVEDGKQFSLMMFNPYQTKFIENCFNKGIPYIILLENVAVNEYYIFDISPIWGQFVSSDKTKISFTWEELKEYYIEEIEDVVSSLKGLE